MSQDADQPRYVAVDRLSLIISNWLLAEQIKEFSPSLVSIQDSAQREALKSLIKGVDKQPEIVVGQDGILEVASHPDAEAVITGIVGCAGLGPTCAAISKGKDICLANKETLIAGELLSACKMDYCTAPPCSIPVPIEMRDIMATFPVVPAHRRVHETSRCRDV